MAMSKEEDAFFRANPGQKSRFFRTNPYYKYEPTPQEQAAKLAKEASKSALDYQKNLPNLQEQNQNTLQDQARGDLARAYVNADQGANRRGMLYGGQRAGMRGQAETGVANDLANNIHAGNQRLINTSRDIGNLAMQSGINSRNTQQDLNNQAYDQALSDRSRGSFMSNLGGFVPGLIGGLMGRASPKSELGLPGGTAKSSFGNDYSMSMPTGVGTK